MHFANRLRKVLVEGAPRCLETYSPEAFAALLGEDAGRTSNGEMEALLSRHTSERLQMSDEGTAGVGRPDKSAAETHAQEANGVSAAPGDSKGAGDEEDPMRISVLERPLYVPRWAAALSAVCVLLCPVARLPSRISARARFRSGGRLVDTRRWPRPLALGKGVPRGTWQSRLYPSCRLDVFDVKLARALQPWMICEALRMAFLTTHIGFRQQTAVELVGTTSVVMVVTRTHLFIGEAPFTPSTSRSPSPSSPLVFSPILPVFEPFTFLSSFVLAASGAPPPVRSQHGGLEGRPEKRR